MLMSNKDFGEQGAFGWGDGKQYQKGITKREYFAAMAMQWLLDKYGTVCIDQHARASVLIADALIKELNK